MIRKYAPAPESNCFRKLKQMLLSVDVVHHTHARVHRKIIINKYIAMNNVNAFAHTISTKNRSVCLNFLCFFLCFVRFFSLEKCWKFVALKNNWILCVGAAQHSNRPNETKLGKKIIWMSAAQNHIHVSRLVIGVWLTYRVCRKHFVRVLRFTRWLHNTTTTQQQPVHTQVTRTSFGTPILRVLVPSSSSVARSVCAASSALSRIH